MRRTLVSVVLVLLVGCGGEASAPTTPADASAAFNDAVAPSVLAENDFLTIRADEVGRAVLDYCSDEQALGATQAREQLLDKLTSVSSPGTKMSQLGQEFGDAAEQACS